MEDFEAYKIQLNELLVKIVELKPGVPFVLLYEFERGFTSTATNLINAQEIAHFVAVCLTDIVDPQNARTPVVMTPIGNVTS